MLVSVAGVLSGTLWRGGCPASLLPPKGKEAASHQSATRTPTGLLWAGDLAFEG